MNLLEALGALYEDLVSAAAFLLFAIPLTVIAARAPAWAEPFRLQTRRQRPQELVGPSIRAFIVNNAFLLVLTMLAWPLLSLTGIHAGALPSPIVALAQVIFFVYLDDILYYSVHKRMHEGWLWKRVHSVHHRIHTPWAITGHYMHPLEYVVTGALMLVGPMLVGAHVVVLWVWVAVRQLEAAEGHAGYDFPFSPTHWLPGSDGARHHDAHHAKVKGNYAGFLAWFDGVRGTFVSGYERTEPGRGEAIRWLVERYFVVAAGIVLAGVPLLFIFGGVVDAVALGAYLVFTLVTLAWSKRAPFGATRAHLVLVHITWAVYAAHPDAMLSRLGQGSLGYVAALLFLLITFTTLDGIRGAAWSVSMTVLGLFNAYDRTEDIVAGCFFVGLGLLMGAVFRTLTLHLDAANAKLDRQAKLDDLTGVLNRRGLSSAVSRMDVEATVFLIALSRFKTANEVFGIAVGDRVLVEVTERLAKVGGVETPIARVGGDEFVLVIPTQSVEQARALASEFVRAIDAPFEISGHLVKIAAECGIARFRPGRQSFEAALANADTALHRAKRGARKFSVHGTRDDLMSARHVEVDLWRAINDGEFVVHYQPVVEAATGRAVGVEALVRWEHPTRGSVVPASFIPLAEETGQIVDIDRIVMEQVARDLERWVAEGLELWVAVNVSVRTFDDPELCTRLESLVDLHPACRDRLVVEVTETAAMKGVSRFRATIERMLAAGVRTAIDDFGTGYSSLAYLREIPASHLKLDWSFTQGIGENASDEAVVEMVLGLAHKLGKHVVAEGIEREAQLKWLAERGCDFVQGYFVARPAPAKEAIAFIRANMAIMKEAQS